MTAITFAMTSRTPIERPSRFAHLLEILNRRRADARARRALAHIDARTLRDIGLTQKDAIVFSLAQR